MKYLEPPITLLSYDSECGLCGTCGTCFVVDDCERQTFGMIPLSDDSSSQEKSKSDGPPDLEL